MRLLWCWQKPCGKIPLAVKLGMVDRLAAPKALLNAPAEIVEVVSPASRGT